MEVVSIGLEDDVVAALRKRTTSHITAYQAVPKMYVHKGRIHIESDRAMDLYLTPKIVLWYGYYQDKHEQRMALALSEASLYPDIRKTLPWDDKMNAVLLMNEGQNIGYFPKNVRYLVRETLGDDPTVIKWGNDHCGEGKVRMPEDWIENQLETPPNVPLYTEPYFQGESYRVLIVEKAGNYGQEYVSILKYESKDWRKNVGSTVTKLVAGDIPPGHAHTMIRMARSVISRHKLEVAGIDFPSGRRYSSHARSQRLPVIGRGPGGEGAVHRQCRVDDQQRRVLELSRALSQASASSSGPSSGLSSR